MYIFNRDDLIGRDHERDRQLTWYLKNSDSIRVNVNFLPQFFDTPTNSDQS